MTTSVATPTPIAIAISVIRFRMVSPLPEEGPPTFREARVEPDVRVPPLKLEVDVRAELEESRFHDRLRRLPRRVVVVLQQHRTSIQDVMDIEVQADAPLTEVKEL